MTPAPHRFSLRPAVPEDLPFLEAMRRTVMRAVIENHYPGTSTRSASACWPTSTAPK